MVKERAEQRQREQAERKKEWKEEREGGRAGGREPRPGPSEEAALRGGRASQVHC